MKRRLTVAGIVLGTIVMVAVGVPRAQTAPAVELRTAIELEKVAGDTQKAIEIYKRLTGSGDSMVARSAREALTRLGVPVADGRGASANQDVPPFKQAALGFLQGLGNRFSVSPDGQTIAYESPKQGLGLHYVGGGPDKFLSGVSAEFFVALAWSPDGTRLAFHSLGSGASPQSVRVVTVSTGRVETVDSWADTSSVTPFSMAWSADGQFVGFGRTLRDKDGWCVPVETVGCRTEIRVVNAAGGGPAEVVGVSGRGSFVWSPSGHELAYTTSDSSDVIFVTPGQKGARTVAIPGRLTLVAWTRDNSLWYLRASSNAPLSVSRFLLASGESVSATAPGDKWISVTPDGSSVLVHKPAVGRLAIRRGSDGIERPLTTGAGKEILAMLSPDGRLVFFASNREGRWALYVVPVDRAPVANPVRLAQLAGVPGERDLKTSGGGSWWSAGLIVLATGFNESHIVRLGLGPQSRRILGTPERLTVNWPQSHRPSPAPGGKLVAFNTTGNARLGIAVMDPNGSRERIVLENDRLPKLRWRTADELLYSEGQTTILGPAFHTVNPTTGAKGRPAFPDLPVDQVRETILDWDYLPATDEIMFVTRLRAPYRADMKKTGPYSFRLHSLRDGRHRTVATRYDFDYPDGGTLELGVSADGRFVAFTADRLVKVMDLQNPVEDRTLPPDTGSLSSISWSPDGRHLLGCNRAGRCFVIAMDSGQSWPLVESNPADQTVRWSDARWSADGTSVYAGRSGGNTKAWFAFEGVTYEAVTRLMNSR